MNGLNTPSIIDALAALADPIRGRILLALERHELAVGELAVALQLPQSTVSRHLKTLVEAGWVASRPEGTSRHYRLAHGASVGEGRAARPGSEGAPPRALWRAVRGELAALASAAHDGERLRAVVADRRAASQAFFSQSAEAWDRLRVELFGSRADLLPLLTLVDDAIVVGDLGCGTGAAAEALAPFVRRLIAVDRSPAMLAVARRRLARAGNVELREGDLEALPLDDGVLDVALLGLVLHHTPEPWTVIAEAARVVRPGGRIVIVDMLPHDREGYRQQMGHVWLGFAPEQLAPWLADAGLVSARVIPLPPDPAGKGPPLFTASARRRADVPDARGPVADALTSRTMEFA